LVDLFGKELSLLCFPCFLAEGEWYMGGLVLTLIMIYEVWHFGRFSLEFLEYFILILGGVAIDLVSSLFWVA